MFHASYSFAFRYDQFCQAFPRQSWHNSLSDVAVTKTRGPSRNLGGMPNRALNRFVKWEGCLNPISNEISLSGFPVITCR